MGYSDEAGFTSNNAAKVVIKNIDKIDFTTWNQTL